MRKSFFILLVVALGASVLSLAYYRPVNPCGSFGNLAMCYQEPAKRGYPFGVPIETSMQIRSSELLNIQFLLFFVNFAIYFFVFGSGYFVYSKLITKGKKK